MHWLPGTIIERVGKSPTYMVSVPSLGRDVHRHANQLRKRLPIELDEQCVPRVHPCPPRPEPPHQSPLKRPKRDVRAPKRLVVDPNRKRYEEE